MYIVMYISSGLTFNFNQLLYSVFCMKCLTEKKWIHPNERRFKREVTFVDDTDDAIAEICLVDEDKDGSVIILDGSKKVY